MLCGVGSASYTGIRLEPLNPVEGHTRQGARLSFLPVSNWKEFEFPFWRFSLAQHELLGFDIHRWRCLSFLPGF